MTPSPSGHPALRDLPSIDRLLRAPGAAELIDAFGRGPATDALRAALDETRAALRDGNGHGESVPPDWELVAAARERLERELASTLRPVINATGVIIHTNLGRAPLGDAALAAAAEAAAGYATLEYDLASGRRGSRAVHAERLLTRLTGAAAALVVNNNAAAVLLMLSALCRGREVLISRGQLVEIGGGFRIPDVMAQSGARLVEVGTTNRTRVSDYAGAITPDTAAILVVHHSNYKIVGFTGEPGLAELAELARAQDLLLLFDQGSGALLDTTAHGLAPEPTVLDGLRAGCDVVAFSGDKLLGGPQAGIIAGKRELVQRIRKNPLFRALRVDKLTIAALEATLLAYLREAWDEIPALKMARLTRDEIAARANGVVKRLRAFLPAGDIEISLIEGYSVIGGGSTPDQSLPTSLIAISCARLSANELHAHLHTPADGSPVIARVEDGRLLLDLRTVFPEQDEALLHALRCALTM